MRSRENGEGEGDEQEKDFRLNDGSCSSDESHREGKITLRTYNVEAALVSKVDSKLIRDTPKKLHCS
jgi:hypothetical protein